MNLDPIYSSPMLNRVHESAKIAKGRVTLHLEFMPICYVEGQES